MRSAPRKHAATIVISTITSLVDGGGGAMAIVANADKVDGYHANEIVRLAFSQSTNDALVGDGSTRNVLTTSIRAPEPGYLVMIASSDVVGGTDTGHQCFLTVDGMVLPSTSRAVALEADDSEENCGTEGVQPVASGVHKVAFRADPNVGTSYDEATLEVLFVPFGSTGAPPSA